MDYALDLPLWLQEALPTPVVPHHVSMGNNGAHVLTAPDGSVTEYATLEALHTDFKGDLSIGDDVYEFHGEDPKHNLGLTYPAGRGLVALVMSHTDEDRMSLLLHSYAYALKCAEAYEAAPTDFVTAYNFVDSHPAFWTVGHDAWHWETSGHCNRVYQMVMVDKATKRHTIALETGAHVAHEDEGLRASSYTTHYHDYRLDVYAPTFEAAYIDLAAMVHKFFYPDGTERPEVDHDKPQWVQDVEASVADFNEQQAAYDAEESAMSEEA